MPITRLRISSARVPGMGRQHATARTELRTATVNTPAAAQTIVTNNVYSTAAPANSSTTAQLTLEQLLDAAIVSPQVGQCVMWNGYAWVNAYPFLIESVAESSNVILSPSLNFVEMDATSGNLTATLPQASTVVGETSIYGVIKTDSSVHTVTLTAYAGDTINGASTFALTTQYQAVQVYLNSAGNGWWIS